MINTCNGCTESWTGSRPCHCGTCHRTFGGLALFDSHRSRAGGEHGRCVDPTSPALADLMEFRDGMWRGPEMTDEAKAKAFGVAS